MDSPTSSSLRVIADLNARDLLPVVREVCRMHGVTLEEVCGRLRSQSVNRARHELWWRVRNHPERHYSFSDLARIFDRHPSSIQEGIAVHAHRLAKRPRPEHARD
jgi:hypothetical protein